MPYFPWATMCGFVDIIQRSKCSHSEIWHKLLLKMDTSLMYPTSLGWIAWSDLTE